MPDQSASEWEWPLDKTSFRYNLVHFHLTDDPGMRGFFHRRMCAIQARWPTLIKKSEIPALSGDTQELLDYERARKSAQSTSLGT